MQDQLDFTVPSYLLIQWHDLTKYTAASPLFDYRCSLCSKCKTCLKRNVGKQGGKKSPSELSSKTKFRDCFMFVGEFFSVYSVICAVNKILCPCGIVRSDRKTGVITWEFLSSLNKCGQFSLQKNPVQWAYGDEQQSWAVTITTA